MADASMAGGPREIRRAASAVVEPEDDSDLTGDPR
jgi:hypothetical protein